MTRATDLPKELAEVPEVQLSRFRGGHAEWAEATLSVRDKLGVLIPYKLQPAQLKFNRAVLECRRVNKPIRIIYLKARQVMVSTAVAAQFIQQVGFTPGQKARIVAHEEDAAMNLFRYYDVFDTYYKGTREWPFQKLRRTQNARLSGMIEYEGGGHIHVQTARNLHGGRSASNRLLHLSEFAFWRDARALMTGLLQVVPDDPDTMVVKESTANGMGGAFYEDWLEACNGSTEWVPVFFGYWEHPEYVRPVADPAKFQESLSKEEIDEKVRYNLTLAQLHWRRWAIKNKCQNSLDRFRQEYPGNPEEAFLRSGRPRFHIPSLARMPIIRDPLVGELEEQQTGPKTSLVFLPNAEGLLTLYKKPAHGHEYVIGVDVAEGQDAALAGGGSSDPDYSVAHVADRDSGEQVCKVRGRIEAGPFGDYVWALARWYNWAYLVPEANGPGIALIEVLIRNGYPPSLIYRRRPLPTEILAADNSAVYQMLGWKTSEITRTQLISAHDMAIRNFETLFRDANTVAEHMSFVWTKRNRCEASDNSHDDEVFAAALATIGLMQPLPDRRLLGLSAPKPAGASKTVKYGKRRSEDERRGTTLRFLT